MVQDRWAAYEAWNNAIEQVYFPWMEEPRPVYLSIEDEDLAQLAEVVGVPARDAMDELSAAVRGVLDRSTGPSSLFAGVRTRTQLWSRGLKYAVEQRARAHGAAVELPAAPPVLPVLAACTLAAELMHQGDDMSSGNYYGRLRQVLALDDVRAEAWVQEAYRRDVLGFWDALNRWLGAHEGDRGLRTARVVSETNHRRYIRPAVGQALVRRAEREKFVAFFQTFDLAPGVPVDEAQLEPMLDAWLDRARTPSPRLRHLWHNTATRPRVVEAAAASLLAWDGSVPRSSASDAEGGVGRGRARVRLAFELSTFPKRFCRFSVLFNTPEAGTTRDVEVITPSGNVPAVLYPAAGGEMSLGAEASMDAHLLLEGVFRVADPVGGELVRQPRAVVPFKHDGFSQLWVEAQQVQFGDELRIVVREQRAARLEALLAEVARPGWSDVTEKFSLPAGWRLYQDVEVLRAPAEVPNSIDDFAFLMPSTERQIRVGKGVRIPTRFGNKWHLGVPPEIVGASSSAEQVHIVLRDAETGEMVDGGGGTDDGAALDLSGSDLGEGKYVAELFEGNEATTTVNFELVSGRTRDEVSWHRLPGLSYPEEATLGFLGVEGEHQRRPERPLVGGVPVKRHWENAGVVAAAIRKARPALQFATIDENSCLYTGSHRIHVETPEHNSKGRPLQKYVRGECPICGLSRMFTTQHWTIRKSEHQTPVRVAPKAELPEVRHVDRARWDVLLDALNVLGGGAWSAFERVALQIDQSGLFVDQACRSLEALGHLVVQRDPRTLKPVAWEMADTRRVPTAGGAEALTGYWAPHVIEELEGCLPDGAHLVSEEQADAPMVWSLAGVGEPDDEQLTGNRWDDVEHWLENLPRMSEVLEALPRAPFLAPTDGTVTRFNVATAKWDDVDSAVTPGAFRVRRFGTDDLVRTAADIERGEAAASTVQLSKHLAALLAGKPLMAHSGTTLAVPKGADLPGMFGRVAVACSGHLPYISGNSLVYEDVPAAVAARLHALLTN